MEWEEENGKKGECREQGESGENLLLEEAAQRECNSWSEWKVQRKYGGIYKG